VRPLLVFGARPNFMKIAPLYRVMRARPEFDPVLVHTGQHFDRSMSDEFIEVLELPPPDVHLNVGPGSQAWQIAEVMKRLEAVIENLSPDLTVVVGDVSSTLAAALTSATREVPVAHVEAGLRSHDWSMPEERNRVLVDRLSRYLFTPSRDADENLGAEGIAADRIFMVGNVMIDSLDWVLPHLAPKEIRASFGVGTGPYGLVTLHRPSNVDDRGTLSEIVVGLEHVAEELPLLFPVHPRTRLRLEAFGLDVRRRAVRLLPPISYSEFMGLLVGARLVLTDSGGIQEEATVLGIPCLTLRPNTERPITLTYGANELVASNRDSIVEAARRRLGRPPDPARRPPLWDGKAAERIAQVLAGRDDLMGHTSQGDTGSRSRGVAAI
jgi:UDP-N-acetylglucosamine 2-epimerase (non-hydrolysing)